MFDNLNIISHLPIYPEKSGGYLRIFNIARLATHSFKNTSIFAVDENIEYSGTLCGINVIQSRKYINSIDKLNYFYRGVFSKNFSLKTSSQAFENTKSSLYQIEGPHFYNLLLQKGIKNYILDEHNVYWELYNFPPMDLKEKIFNKIAFNRDKNVEIQALKNAAHVIVCSNRDKINILEVVPEIESNISIIPNCVNLSEYEIFQQNNVLPSHNKFYILFMGLLSYFPNKDAVNLICNKIAPCFGNDVKFIIVGKNPPITKHPDNVEFLGYVDDIKKYVLQSDICISPLRYGSGTRFKILEYMAMGKLVISTTKGAEGIDYTNMKNIIIEDNIDIYPQIINQLIENKEKRESIGKEAIELIRNKYNWDSYLNVLDRIYTNI